MELTNDHIKKRLIEKFGDDVTNFTEPYGMLTFEVPKDSNLKMLQFLYDDPELKFQFLTDVLTGWKEKLMISLELIL